MLLVISSGRKWQEMDGVTLKEPGRGAERIKAEWREKDNGGRVVTSLACIIANTHFETYTEVRDLRLKWGFLYRKVILFGPQFIKNSFFSKENILRINKIHRFVCVCEWVYVCVLLTIVSRPTGAEKTYSSWKMIAKAWWLVSWSSKLLRRPSIWGRGDVAVL